MNVKFDRITISEFMMHLDFIICINQNPLEEIIKIIKNDADRKLENATT